METTPDQGMPYTDSDVEHAAARLRDIAASLPEVSERLSHGNLTFFVREKRVLGYFTDDLHGDRRLALTCPAPPGAQDELLRSEPTRFFRPPYVGHRGWIGIRLDLDPDWDEVAHLVREAYRCVAPKALARQLD